MKFSEAYVFTCQKSLAYLTACKVVEIIDFFLEFKSKLQHALRNIVASKKGLMRVAERYVANIDELDEELTSLLELFEGHSFHQTPAMLRDYIPRLRDFIKHYEAVAKVVRCVAASNFGRLRSYGVPWDECEELALYITGGGRLCVPDMGSWCIIKNVPDLVCRAYYDGADRSKEGKLASALLGAYMLQKLVRQGHDFRNCDVHFVFLTSFSKVPYKYQGDVVAVPVMRCAAEADRCADEALIKAVFDS